MIRRINAVNVCMAIAGLALILFAGFAEGGNYAAAVICLGACAGSAYLAVREDGRGENDYY